MGWSQHQLGGYGEVLSITPIYADSEDRLYFHVRRPDDTGNGYKEYMEVLLTRYFSAKRFEMHKPVYTDCHINVSSPSENAIARSVAASINNDTACEFRGGITKLEHIIQSQAETILKLDLASIDIQTSFRFKGKLISEYGQNAGTIAEFIQKYYREYLQIIFETLGACFAFTRMFGRIYASLENVFCGEPEQLATVEQLIYDGERLGGDIINTVENIMQGWDLPPIILAGGLIEYPSNNAFSFHTTICSKIKTINIEAIRTIINLSQDIIAAAKTVIDAQFEVKRELEEMRLAVAQINKRMLEYYQEFDHDNSKELLVNLKKFFEKTDIDFYTELLNIAHPTLTPYLFSNDAKALVNRELAAIDQATDKAQMKECTTTIINNLITRLEQKHTERKTDEIIAFKRREEITELLKSLILEKDLSTDNKEYILSSLFTEHVNGVIDDYEFHGVVSDDEPASAAGELSSSDSEESQSLRVNALMHSLKDIVDYFRKSLIDLCPLIMPSSHSALLKNILEDEKSIKLEKYLLLSKKYFPTFKKMFPEIGAYELSVIAKNCLPSFDKLNLKGILPVFRKNSVAIIGDEELHDIRILNDEQIKLKHSVRHLSIGFPYRSVMQTFPFIFPDEVEHSPKKDTEIGIKLFNTKGGYIEEKTDNSQIERQHVNSRHIDSDELIRFTTEKKYLATKELCDVLATPYISDWVNFISSSSIQTDIDCTYVVDKPYPASILKIYAKAKILANYK